MIKKNLTCSSRCSFTSNEVIKLWGLFLLLIVYWLHIHESLFNGVEKSFYNNVNRQLCVYIIHFNIALTSLFPHPTFPFPWTFPAIGPFREFSRSCYKWLGIRASGKFLMRKRSTCRHKLLCTLQFLPGLLSYIPAPNEDIRGERKNRLTFLIISAMQILVLNTSSLQDLNAPRDTVYGQVTEYEGDYPTVQSSFLIGTSFT